MWKEFSCNVNIYYILRYLIFNKYSNGTIDVCKSKNESIIKENEILSDNEDKKEEPEKKNENISLSKENKENEEHNENKKETKENALEKEQNLNEEKNSEGILFTKEKVNINFDLLIQEIRESEIEASQTRIETYELKGFNSMEPSIQLNNNEKKDPTLVSALIDAKNIDKNYMELMKITNEDLDYFQDIHYGKIKIKRNTFDKIFLEEIKVNKYGNINLINCIYMLLNEDSNYFQNMFIKFEPEQNEFEYKCYLNGQEETILFGNKIIKNTKFIHPPESNFWIFFIEKSIAKLYKHYMNTYNLMASDLYQNLSPFNIKIYHHIYFEKKEIYNLIKDNLNKDHIIFCEIDPLEISVIDNINNLFISYYISNIFKINGRKYVELFLPYNKGNDDKIISLSDEKITNEDLKNKELFSKVGNNHYYYINFNDFLQNFGKTFILEYSKNFFYINKKIRITDGNINFLKFRVSGNGKIKLCTKINLPRCYLCRCILAKLTITEDVIRKIKTMSSEKSEDNDADIYYEEQIDYDFEYLDSFYDYGLINKFDSIVENGTYCLLFNVYTNNEFDLNISLLSYFEGTNIEFLDTTEKISGEKLNAQIKRLFISYMKKNIYKNVTKKRIKDNAFSYKSLYNEKLGYSIFMVDNNTEEYNILVDIVTENTGMNLITKEYEEENNYLQNSIHENSKLIKILVPPKNNELIIFEWEKSIDNIYINLTTNIVTQKIEYLSKTFNIDEYEKKPIQNTDVYLVEVQYTKGAFLIFVNESQIYEYAIHLYFDNVFNLKYKNYDTNDLKEKEINIKVKKNNYYYLNLKAVTEGEYGYNINLKIQKINQE